MDYVTNPIRCPLTSRRCWNSHFVQFLSHPERSAPFSPYPPEYLGDYPSSRIHQWHSFAICLIYLPPSFLDVDLAIGYFSVSFIGKAVGSSSGRYRSFQNTADVTGKGVTVGRQSSELIGKSDGGSGELAAGIHTTRRVSKQQPDTRSSHSLSKTC